jgi:hypothetical protein
MTEKAAHVYLTRPSPDDPDLWELVDKGSGQVLMRGSERLVKAKAGLNVDYEAQGVGMRPPRGTRRRKRER